MVDIESIASRFKHLRDYLKILKNRIPDLEAFARGITLYLKKKKYI